MRSQPHPSNHHDLHATRRQFTRWRATHLPGTRIPDHLWSAAVDSANAHGLSRTARILGLDYGSLRDRAERAASASSNAASDRRTSHSEGHSSAESAATPEFIEFSFDSPMSPRACVVEIVGASDLKLRIDLKGYPASELDAILRTAWETARCSS